MISNILLTITALFSALIAGLFFTWSVSIVWGLNRLSDSEYVSAMQSINREIQNPIFLVTFLATTVLLPVVTFFHISESIRFKLLLIASVIYLAGVVGVTMFGNVPMNNALDKFELETATKEEISSQRGAYENRWNNLNHIRAISSTLVILLVIMACLSKDA